MRNKMQEENKMGGRVKREKKIMTKIVDITSLPVVRLMATDCNAIVPANNETLES